MDRFKFEIDVEIKDIPHLDDAHKRDCSDAVNKIIGSVFKYTLLFGAATIALFALYTIFGMFWTPRMGSMLPPISPLIPLAAILVVLLEFAAGTMQSWGIAAEIIVLAGMIMLSITAAQNLIFIPFALDGIWQHVKLFRILPFFRAISELPGYPDFTPLPVKEKSPKKKAANAAKNDTDTENKS